MPELHQVSALCPLGWFLLVLVEAVPLLFFNERSVQLYRFHCSVAAASAAAPFASAVAASLRLVVLFAVALVKCLFISVGAAKDNSVGGRFTLSIISCRTFRRSLGPVGQAGKVVCIRLSPSLILILAGVPNGVYRHTFVSVGGCRTALPFNYKVYSI